MKRKKKNRKVQRKERYAGKYIKRIEE